MLTKARSKSKTGKTPEFISPETWEQWKIVWELPENKAISARNSANRRGGKDKAEATHIGGSVPHAKTMRDMENSMGQKPTPYEVFTKTHGVFDAESGNCSQWTNTKAEKVHAEYRALQEEHPTEDPNQIWLDAVNNIDHGKKKKNKIVFGLGSASQYMYPQEPPRTPTSQPDFLAIIEEKFKELEERQKEFNDRLEEAFQNRFLNAATASEIHRTLSNQVVVERECYQNLLRRNNMYQCFPQPPNQ
ncbi:unnamed protein product [Amaranthus hypochondriacus]